MLILGVFNTPISQSAEATLVRSKIMPSINEAPVARLPGKAKSPPQVISLAEISEEVLFQKKATASRKHGSPRNIGISRSIEKLATKGQVASILQWSDNRLGGRTAAVSVRSPGAVGTRLGIQVGKLPPDSILRFYAPASLHAEEISATSILSLLERNRARGNSGDNDKVFWGPYIEGEETTLEIQLPNGVAETDLDLTIPRLSHIYENPLTSPNQKQGPFEKIGESDSCEINVACYSTWSKEADSTAKMMFVEDGNSYMCTGTLLNDTAGSLTPYFLSANHCISDQTVASTLETYWFYRADGCGNQNLLTTAQKKVGGAVLLHSSESTDTSFMRLLTAPPGGARFSGWTLTTPQITDYVSSIHHPAGDLQKISFGAIAGYAKCSGSGYYTCDQLASSSGANHFNVRWAAGTTEPGSSGAGLFISDGPDSLLVGQLHGGNAACGNNETDQFGRFDLAYGSGLKKWLAPSDAPESGWWWNAAEPGRGYFVEVSNGRFYLGSFLYNDAGYPIWYATGPESVQGSTISGKLGKYLGGQSLNGSYITPSGPFSQGSISIQFNDSTHGTISWPGGTVPITRYEIAAGSLGAASPSFKPETGWWWNPAEGGRGFSLEVQGSYLFIAGYMYDENGNPIWYVSGAKMMSDNYYEGTWQQCSNGLSLAGKGGNAKCTNLASGTLSIYFPSKTTATMRLPNGKYISLNRFTF